MYMHNHMYTLYHNLIYSYFTTNNFVSYFLTSFSIDLQPKSSYTPSSSAHHHPSRPPKRSNSSSTATTSTSPPPKKHHLYRPSSFRRRPTSKRSPSSARCLAACTDWCSSSWTILVRAMRTCRGLVIWASRGSGRDLERRRRIFSMRRLRSRGIIR